MIRTPDRAASALLDVVAIERMAPGMVRVVTWSDAYTVDVFHERCECPDMKHHLDGDGRCKHVHAARLVSEQTDLPAVWDVSDDLSPEPDRLAAEPLPDFEDYEVVADGGQDRVPLRKDDRSDSTKDYWHNGAGDAPYHRDDDPCDDAPENGYIMCDADDIHNLSKIELCGNCKWPEWLVDSAGGVVVTDGGQVQHGGNRPAGHDQFTVWDPDRENAHHFDKRGPAEDKMEMAADLDIEAELFPPGESPEALYHEDGDPDTDAEPTHHDETSDEPTEPCAICGDDVAIPDATTGPEGEPVHPGCDTDDETPDAEVVDHSPDAEPAPEPEPAPDANHEPEVLSPDEVEQYAADLDERDVGQDPLKWMPGEFVDTIDGTEAINRKGFEVLRFFYGVDLSMSMEVDPVDNDMTHCRYKCVAYMPDEDPDDENSGLEAWGTSHVDRGDDPWLLVEMAATRARKRALSIATGAGAVAVEELRNEVSE
jgi:hypothetical protein